MRSRVRCWRWRPNPLRRRSHVVEAWTSVVVAVLLVVGAPLAGVAAGWWAQLGARTAAAEQRAGVHRVNAVLVADAPAAAPSAHAGKQPTHRVRARWAEPGEGMRSGTALVPAGTRRGDRAYVWLDSRGRSVAPPPTEEAVRQQSFAIGACVTGGAVAVVLLGHLVVRRVTLRHRLAEWEREWAHTGPEWGRRWA